MDTSINQGLLRSIPMEGQEKKQNWVAKEDGV